MTQEDKKLLLIDLCARLPYYTELYSNVADGNWAILTPVVISNLMSATDKMVIKPYLRPMYSMTEEEVKEYKAFHCVAYEHTHFYPQFCTVANELNMFDWLNKKMFDYRGLIGKGLAIEITNIVNNK